MRIRAAVVLGVRLATLSGYASRARAVLLAVTAFVVTFLALCVVTAPQVMSAQQERRNARDVVETYGVGPTRVWADEVDRESPAGRLWNGHQVTRLYVAGPADAPVPPGIASLPRPGQMYVSPALQDLLEQDSLVGTLFDGNTVVGQIAPAGLVTPQEARAVVGINRTPTGLQEASGFGTSGTARSSSSEQLNRILAVIMLVLILIPTLALVAVSTRMSGRQRRSRAVALRLMGLSRPVVRTVMAIETLLVAGPAAVAGLAVFLLLRPRVSSIPGTGFGFHPTDARVPATVTALVTLAVVAVFVATAMLVQRDGAASVRPRLAFQRHPRVPITILAVGLLTLLPLQFSSRLPDGVGAMGLWITIGVVIASLAWSGPALVSLTAARLIPRCTSGGMLVGMRISAHEPGTAARMASALTVVIVTLGATIPFVAILNGGDPDDSAQGLARSNGVTLSLTEGAALQADTIASWDGVRQVIPLRSFDGARAETISVLVATCPQLQALTKARVQRCTGRTQWITTDNSDFDLGARTKSIAVPGHRRILVPPADRAVFAEGVPYRLQGTLLLPPDTITLDALPIGDYGTSALVNVDNADVPITLARIFAATPTANVAMNEYSDPDSADFPGQVRLVLLGSLLCLALGILALTTAALGDTTTRRARITGLLALGAPRTDILRAHFATTVYPLAFLGTLASATSWLTAQALHGLDDRADTDPFLYPGLALGAIVVALLIGALTTPPLLASLHPTELRDHT